MNMKIAIIGCGKIAISHIKAIVNNKLDLVAICDLLDSHMDTLLKATGYAKPVERYHDYKVMLNEHPEIHLAAIATDSGCHAEIALYCIERGIHILLEKPMAMSLVDADKMIAEAKAHHVKIAMCQQNRYNAAVQKTKEALDAGRFGKISHAAVAIRWSRDEAYYKEDAWRGKWDSDGGTLMNQCIHGIDLLRWLMGGDVSEVYGATRQQFHPYIEGEDLGMALLKFKNGSIATIEGSVNVFPSNLEETLYIFGEKGTVKLGGSACNNIDIWQFDEELPGDSLCRGLTKATSNVYGSGHTYVYADMIKAIQEDREPYISALDGRNAIEISLAIYKSELTGTPVKLPLNDFSTADLKGHFGK